MSGFKLSRVLILSWLRGDFLCRHALCSIGQMIKIRADHVVITIRMHDSLQSLTSSTIRGSLYFLLNARRNCLSERVVQRRSLYDDFSDFMQT